MLNQEIEKAQQFLRDENWQDALEVFQSVLAEEPNSVEALMGLGHAFYHLQRYEEARQALESSLQLLPNDAEAYFLLGSTYYIQKNWYAAMTHYHQAVLLKPSMPEYRLRLYAALQMLDEPELALVELQAAYQLNPHILDPRGKWKLRRARIFAGLGPVTWLIGWGFLGALLTLGGPYSLNQFLAWLGQYLPFASTRVGQLLLRAGIMSLPFAVTAVFHLRKSHHRRALWVMILWAIWSVLIWYIPHQAGWW